MWYGKLTHSSCYDSSTMRDLNREPEETLSPLNCFLNPGVLGEEMQTDSIRPALILSLLSQSLLLD